MKFSVAICTWNRAELLRRTLESLCNLQTGSIPWELLVVNNNCTDATDAVCQSFSTRLPLRTVHETEQGHSVSRNRAIREATGTYIVWTDDDVLIDPEFLAAYDSATNAYPDAAFLGGKIIPSFDCQPARWISDNWETCSGVFAARDLGDVSVECNKESLPYGANLVVRLDVQRQFLFRSEFGRQADTVRGFDEIDVLHRLLDAGHRGYWIPKARVDHLIPESRMTLEYFARYFHGQGETWITRGVTTPDRNQLKRQIRKLSRSYWFNSWRSSTIWFPKFVVLQNLRGQLSRLMQIEAHR